MNSPRPRCHCEERSDEAISLLLYEIAASRSSAPRNDGNTAKLNDIFPPKTIRLGFNNYGCPARDHWTGFSLQFLFNNRGFFQFQQTNRVSGYGDLLNVLVLIF